MPKACYKNKNTPLINYFSVIKSNLGNDYCSYSIDVQLLYFFIFVMKLFYKRVKVDTVAFYIFEDTLYYI